MIECDHPESGAPSSFREDELAFVARPPARRLVAREEHVPLVAERPILGEDRRVLFLRLVEPEVVLAGEKLISRQLDRLHRRGLADDGRAAHRERRDKERDNDHGQKRQETIHASTVHGNLRLGQFTNWPLKRTIVES